MSNVLTVAFSYQRCGFSVIPIQPSEKKPGLLIVDVLQKFCRIKDLNDYAQVTNALEPLMAMAREESCHILLTHHAGKSERQDGDDILGSTALLGGVGTLVQLKKRDKRRTFFTIQGTIFPRL
jgi:RecA-family ATPase